MLASNNERKPSMVHQVRNSFLSISIIFMFGFSKLENKNMNEIETNIRIPVVIQNIPSHKYSLLERMKHFEVPGVSVAVIEYGKISWAKGYGVLEEGKEKAVDTETVFQAASMSKPFTALATMI